MSVLPKKIGSIGSETSTKEVLFVVAIIAYSLLSKVSVQPQISFPSGVPEVFARVEIGIF
jgi:hypothetical protein